MLMRKGGCKGRAAVEDRRGCIASAALFLLAFHPSSGMADARPDHTTDGHFR